MPLGYSNFRKSLPLLGKSLFENIRQQGVRLILAPLSGPAGLAAFSTMRTGANVALQGLNTIINPLVPDLMRFLHDRDQQRSEAAFATIWIVLVALMAPGVVILQAFVEPFYLIWTQGKIDFNPLLFALLSLGVLVYAVIQPAIAVVVGNNLTKTQLHLTALSGVIVLGVLIALVPLIGILGAAIGLLLGEIVAAVGYKIYAKRWLRENDLLWPRHAFHLAVFSVCVSAVALGALVWFPEYTWAILIVSMALFAWNLLRFWKQLPDIVNQSALRILRRVPGFNSTVITLKKFRWVKKYKTLLKNLLRYPKKIEGYREGSRLG
jgi:O-antigen/teichoic acid export membrane protein